MLIGLNGRKQAGKDTVYWRASMLLDGVLEVERLGFADLLYESAAASLGVGVEELRGWKGDPNIGVAVVVVYDEFHECAPEGVGYYREPLSIREYLQAYGSEAHRSVFGVDFWVDHLNLSDHAGRLVMVTDCRYENEARAIKDAGGVVVRVVGPPGVEHPQDPHASEAPLSEGLIDAWINNHVRDDSFRTLDGQIDTLLRVVLRGGA